MKKLFTLALVAFVAFAANVAKAANADETQYVGGNFKADFWNEVKDNGQYYPNMRITYTPALTETPALALVTYQLINDASGSIVKEGNFGSNTGALTDFHMYQDWGVLAKGGYTVNFHFKFKQTAEDAESDTFWQVKFNAIGAPTDVLVLNGISASDFVCTGSTTGTVKYTINAENLEYLKYFHIYVVRAQREGESGDQPLCEPFDTTDLTGTIDLTDLAENGSTTIWMKCYGVYGDDNKQTSTVQVGYGVQTHEIVESDWAAGNTFKGSVSGNSLSGIPYTTEYTITTGDEGSLTIAIKLTTDEDFEDLVPQLFINNAYFGDFVATRGTDYTGTITVPNKTWGDEMAISFFYAYQGGSFTTDAVNYTVGAVQDPQSGISAINATGMAAGYYNLQGQRVANPENGIFIVVKDGKAIKQIIK